MQKKFPLNSASVSLRALVVLLVCAAACLIVTHTLPAFLQSEAPANVPQRTLTFAERVAYQRAIEDVYWRHRIWPKERPDPKPSLDAVMSQAQLEKKLFFTLATAELFGLLGVFLAVPAAALVQIVIDEFYLQPRKIDAAALDRQAGALVEGRR